MTAISLPSSVDLQEYDKPRCSLRDLPGPRINSHLPAFLHYRISLSMITWKIKPNYLNFIAYTLLVLGSAICILITVLAAFYRYYDFKTKTKKFQSNKTKDIIVNMFLYEYQSYMHEMNQCQPTITNTKQLLHVTCENNGILDSISSVHVHSHLTFRK